MAIRTQLIKPVSLCFQVRMDRLNAPLERTRTKLASLRAKNQKSVTMSIKSAPTTRPLALQVCTLIEQVRQTYRNASFHPRLPLGFTLQQMEQLPRVLWEPTNPTLPSYPVSTLPQDTMLTTSMLHPRQPVQQGLTTPTPARPVRAPASLLLQDTTPARELPLRQPAQQEPTTPTPARLARAPASLLLQDTTPVRELPPRPNVR